MATSLASTRLEPGTVLMRLAAQPALLRRLPECGTANLIYDPGDRSPGIGAEVIAEDAVRASGSVWRRSAARCGREINIHTTPARSSSWTVAVPGVVAFTFWSRANPRAVSHPAAWSEMIAPHPAGNPDSDGGEARHAAAPSSETSRPGAGAGTTNRPPSPASTPIGPPSQHWATGPRARPSARRIQ